MGDVAHHQQPAQHSGTGRIRSILSRVFAVTLLGAMAACTGTGDDSTFAERQELANIKTKNLVPLASVAVLMNTFRAFCLDGDPSVTARTARLRAAGYVPVGGWRNGVRRFVTDTSAPMVQISDDGGLCGVHARARTGQEAEIRQRIAQWFPKAQPVASDDPLQTIWTTGRAPNEGIGILRNPRGRGHNEISVALLRP